MEWTREDYTLTDDRDRADLDAIHRLLRDTYWASARSRASVALSVENSLCFSLFHRGEQIGVARVLTDVGATSYLCDVVVAPEHRARGVGDWLMRCVLEHPNVRTTRMLLVTRDAQSFYQALGFETHPYECMIRMERGTDDGE